MEGEDTSLVVVEVRLSFIEDRETSPLNMLA